MVELQLMENPRAKRWLKKDLAAQVLALQQRIVEMEIKSSSNQIRQAVQDVEDQMNARIEAIEPFNATRWFGVAYIGWGTWEEDVYFVETTSPEEAIRAFEEAVKEHYFEGHGAYNEADRSMFVGQSDTVLVYEVGEATEYEAEKVTTTTWRKV